MAYGLHLKAGRGLALYFDREMAVALIDDKKSYLNARMAWSNGLSFTNVIGNTADNSLIFIYMTYRYNFISPK